MTFVTNRRRLAGALLCGALVLAACGDDDDGEAVREFGETGSGSASGVVSGDTGDQTSSGSDGGYVYASDVSAHRLVTLDVCDVNAALDEDPVDFDAAAAAYRDGGNSVNSDDSVRTLAGFATAEDRLHGVDEYYGSATPLDDFVSQALDGSGDFAGEDDAVRRQGVQKGIQNQVLVAWTIHELETALAKGADGDYDAASGAPHNWDEAWAFYHGAQPGCAPFATANSRAGNFGTLADDGETAQANEAILDAMRTGRDALLDGDLATAEAAADTVVRNLVITYTQAAVRYATLAVSDVEAGDDAKAREHQVEGWAFFRVIEPIVADVGADVDAILAILHPDEEPAANGGGDEVRAALAPALEHFSITDEDIGELE